MHSMQDMGQAEILQKCYFTDSWDQIGGYNTSCSLYISFSFSVYLKLFIVKCLGWGMNSVKTSKSCPCSVGSDSLQPHGLQPTRFLCPCNFSGKNTGVGCHFLLQGIFPTQGSNPHLLHWQVGSLPLSHLGSLCK